MKGKSIFQVIPCSRQRGGYVRVYVCTHMRTRPEDLNLYCLFLCFVLVCLFCLWKGGKGLREFVAKEGKFRDAFHFKVEMREHCQFIPLRSFQRICQLRILKILPFKMSSIHTSFQ